MVTVELTVKTKYHAIRNTKIGDAITIVKINKPAWFQTGDLLILEADNRTDSHSVLIQSKNGSNGGNIELCKCDNVVANGKDWWTGATTGSTAAKMFLALLWNGTYWEEQWRSINYPGA